MSKSPSIKRLEKLSGKKRYHTGFVVQNEENEDRHDYVQDLKIDNMMDTDERDFQDIARVKNMNETKEKGDFDTIKEFIRAGYILNGVRYNPREINTEEKLNHVTMIHMSKYGMLGGSKRKSKRTNTYKRICRKIGMKTTCKCFKNNKKMNCSKYNWPNMQQNAWDMFNFRKF